MSRPSYQYGHQGGIHVIEYLVLVIECLVLARNAWFSPAIAQTELYATVPTPEAATNSVR